MVSALRPVRPPPRRTVTCCSCTLAGGALRSSKCRSRLSAALAFGANVSEYLARCFSSRTMPSSRSRSRWCSSNSCSIRSMRAWRASW